MVGTITPVQEHFVSNVIRQKLIVETDKLPIVAKRRVDAVLFTPEDEFHEISLLFYNYILKKRNYRTLYLGTNLPISDRSEEHTSELQSRPHLVCRLLLEKKKISTIAASPARP